MHGGGSARSCLFLLGKESDSNAILLSGWPNPDIRRPIHFGILAILAECDPAMVMTRASLPHLVAILITDFQLWNKRAMGFQISSLISCSPG